jgi:hypothetical protein
MSPLFELARRVVVSARQTASGFLSSSRALTPKRGSIRPERTLLTRIYDFGKKIRSYRHGRA